MTRVVALAGGVGGAKLADGLQAHLGADLTVVVNTGDDCWRHGLLVMPDHDTVLYNLAGIEQVEWGWGIEGDTHATMAQLGVYGEETWFGLGDRDLALHIVRTARLRAGDRLTDACLGAQRSLGIAARILPMSDDPVATEVRTADGWLEFQEYFVHQRQAPDVLELRFAGYRGGGADARRCWRPSRTPRRSSSRPPTRSSRSRRSSTCPACATAISAARARGVPVVGGLADHRRQGAQGACGPDARRARPRVVARSASRGCTPTSSTSSSSTRRTPRLRPRSRRSASGRS